MTAPITPDERAAMRRLALTTPQTPGEHAYVEHVPRLLDALDTAEAEVARLTSPARPDREDIYRAWHGTDDPWGGCADSASIERVLDLWPGRSEAEVKAEALRESADWLLRIGYVADITFDIAAPAALWEAFVDAAHRDADGAMHGNSLTRAEVDDWLSVESGRLDAEGETR